MTDPSLDQLNSWQDQARELVKARSYSEAARLYQRLLDSGVVGVAAQLGYVYSRPDNPDFDRNKAISYFRTEAERGDNYAQYSLGALLAQSGDNDGALQWYCKASELGEGTCSFLAYREFARRGDVEASQRYLMKALEQRNPAAIQQYSILKIRGQFGALAILPGLIEYVANLPRMARFVTENVRRPSGQ